MNPDPKARDLDLMASACAGNRAAVGELFERHREKLRRMINLRLDPKLRGRVDVSDVLQEAFIDFAEKVQDHDPEQMPVHLWLRLIAGERLLQVHRKHLDVQKRAVGREVPLHSGGVPDVSSLSLAEQLSGGLTSPSMRASRAETQAKLIALIEDMDTMDREVLVLRHFEGLSNDDVAQLLGLRKAAASNRYVRALGRLRALLAKTELLP